MDIRGWDIYEHEIIPFREMLQRNGIKIYREPTYQISKNSYRVFIKCPLRTMEYINGFLDGARLNNPKPHTSDDTGANEESITNEK